MSNVTRREFTGLSIAAAASVYAHAETKNDNAASVGETDWIDAHVHVWTSDVQQYPIDRAFQTADMKPQSFTPNELFAHCKPVGVNRIVLIQMSFYGFDHRYMFHAMESYPGIFSAVALIDHQSPDVVKVADRLAERGVRGFRINSRGDALTWANDPGMNMLWRHAGEKGLAICPLINPEDIPVVEALCKKFSDTTVVVDHFARIGVSGSVEDKHLSALCNLARFAKTNVKTSAFYALGKKQPPYEDLIPMIRKVVDAFGPERLMWASDCPYQVQGTHTYAASIELIRDRIDFLSASDRNAMLRDTAARLFF